MKISLVFFLSFLCFPLVKSQSDACSSNLDLSNRVPFNTSLHCLSVWNSQSFILRYAKSASSLWSFVLSAPQSNSYVAIGFSTAGKMVGSSAIVGWVTRNGTGNIKQYYLGGQNQAQVRPNQGNLVITNSTIFSLSSSVFLAFQLNISEPTSKLLYAVGPTNVLPGSNGILSQHQDKVSTSFDFISGQSSLDNSYSTLRRSHGLVNMIAWGILMPIGVIIARYFRQWDPLWFYSHISIQLSGFILGFIGIILGFSLDDKTSANVSTHKALGIISLVLACLQVIALLGRPNKASKVRKYWNWYHYGVGRVLIPIAIGNIFFGIHEGGAGKAWNVGYGMALGVLVVIQIVLEVRMYMTY